MDKQEATTAILGHMKEIRQILHEFNPELDYLSAVIVNHDNVSFWTTVDADADERNLEFWVKLPPLDKPALPRHCPKCGAKDIRMGVFNGGYRMHCAECGYRTSRPQPALEEAVEQWNRECASVFEVAVEQWNRECASVAPKLIPCPECGYPHLLIHHWEPRNEDEAESYQVECPACGFVALPANTEADAIELWNRGDDGPALTEDPEEDVW